MKESTLLEIYCPMLIIPFWFILYTLIRLKRHWNDGKEKLKRIKSPTLFLKYLLSSIMILLTIIQILIVYSHEEDYSEIKTIKYILFSSFIGAWIMSILMTYLEVSLRLKMKWAGHRSFWLINLAIYIIFFCLEAVLNKGSFIEYFSNFNMIIDAVGLVVCLILTCLAVFKPNEFNKNKDDISASLIKKARLSVGIRTSMPEDRGLAGAVFVSIKDYKIKVENGKQVVLYNITVKIKGEVGKIRRSYHEFDKLYKSIRRKFPSEIFPYMVFPMFPLFSGMNFTLEQKTQVLNEFLLGLCCPEFMTEDTLDFLNIRGDFREKLSAEHSEIIEAEKGLTVTEVEEPQVDHRSSFAEHKLSIFEKSSKLHTNLHVYFQVKVVVAEQISKQTQYTVSWVLTNTSELATVNKRFKDFAALNTNLKRILYPAMLPKFPEKSYVQNLRKADSQALEIRRRKLEKYLSHILNDPGFMCQELFDFIDCKSDLSLISERPCNIEYEITTPIGWEGELDGTSSYIVYIMGFSKYYEQRLVAEWSVKRTFKDLQFIDSFLSKRARSPQFLKYLKAFTQKISDWPKLPLKHPVSLSNPNEIEICRNEIETYMEELCMVPSIFTAYAFKCFIDDPDSNF